MKISIYSNTSVYSLFIFGIISVLGCYYAAFTHHPMWFFILGYAGAAMVATSLWLMHRKEKYPWLG